MNGKSGKSGKKRYCVGTVMHEDFNGVMPGATADVAALGG